MGLPKMGAFDPTQDSSLPVIQGRVEQQSGSVSGSQSITDLTVDRLSVLSSIRAPLMQSLGFAAGNSSQVVAAGAGWTDVTGSAFNFTVPMASQGLFMIFIDGFLTTAGAGNSTAFRGQIINADTAAVFDNSAPANIGASTIQTGFIWYFIGPGGTFTSIPAGHYTGKVQVNPTGSAFNVNEYFSQLFLLGQQ